ncbi:uncharacterized protein LOC110695671 isoform X2 [Chenopodium quinoa]|uniref:uncharacterized protein LOC110695671 isoform X2 n=1 Tax=Chenopodium quinoa TaxID=63459 RepID=UPI000B798D2F|nr:uncharacterized protein LOC110695671 isoform X2 [Chenopodium quinoa]
MESERNVLEKKQHGNYLDFIQWLRNYRSASLPSWRVIKHSIMSVAVISTTPVFNGSPMRCSCLGTMIDFESAAASSWVPVIDQVLLTASVIFAYMAGVIPSGGSYIRSQTNKSNDLLLPESPIFFGSTTEKEDQLGCHCSWDAVKGKITKSLLAIENGVSVEENTKEYELDRAKRLLNLYAVAIGPRFRLLLSLVEQLEKMVGTGSFCPISLFPCCQFISSDVKYIISSYYVSLTFIC